MNDEECVIYKGYAIPINIMNKYWKKNPLHEKIFQLPEIKTIFEENGLNPELYNITPDSLNLGDMASIENELLDICNKSGYDEKGYAAVNSDDINRLSNAIINVLKLNETADEYNELEIIEMVDMVDDVAIFTENGKSIYQVKIIGKEKKLTKEEKLMAFIENDDISNLYNPLELIFDDNIDDIFDAINESYLVEDTRIKDVAMNQYEEYKLQYIIYTISLIPFVYIDFPGPCDNDINNLVSAFINALKRTVKDYINITSDTEIFDKSLIERDKINKIVARYIMFAYSIINYIKYIDNDKLKDDFINNINDSLIDWYNYNDNFMDDDVAKFTIDDDTINFVNDKLETWLNPNNGSPEYSLKKENDHNDHAVDHIIENALLLSKDVNLNLSSLENKSFIITIPSHKYGNENDEDLIVNVDLYGIITKNIKALKPGATNHLK